MDSNISPTASDSSTQDFELVETFNWQEQEEISLSVVESVATVREMEPTELRPLATVIDTDALNTLFTSTAYSPAAYGYVQFEYERCLVKVTADGQILIDTI